MYDITKGSNLIHGYCFNVEFYINNEYVSIGFSKISALENSAEYDTIVEGNGKIHLVPKYISQPKTVTFSKGIASNESLIINDLKIGRHIKDIVISVGDLKYDNSLRQYLLQDCVITKCNANGCDAIKSEAFIEDFEITYTKQLKISKYNGNYDLEE